MNKTVRFPVICLFLFLILGGCHRTVNESDTPLQGRELWQARNIYSYQFDFSWICFCGSPFIDNVRVFVKNNSLDSLYNITLDRPVDRAYYSNYKTIDELFTFIDSSKALEPAWFRETYDSQWGYPNKVFFDYQSGIADEELGFEILSFTSYPENE